MQNTVCVFGQTDKPFLQGAKKMKKKSILLAVSAITLSSMGWVSVSHADLINENFESYTITGGGDNDPTNPGDGNANNWLVTEAADAVEQIALGSSTAGSGANAQVMNILTASTTDNTRLTRAFTAQTIGTVTASFKIRINSFDTPLNSDYYIRLGDSGLNGVLMRLLPADTSGSIAGFTAQSSPSESVISTVIAGDWYQVTLAAHLDTNNWDLTVTNLDNTDAAQSGSASGKAFFGTIPITGIDTFQIRPVSFGANRKLDISLDDIVVSVPEPASLSLLALGCLLIGSARKRH